jgi:hypothetical protein
MWEFLVMRFLFLTAIISGMKKKRFVNNVCKGQLMTIATRENSAFKFSVLLVQ